MRSPTWAQQSRTAIPLRPSSTDALGRLGSYHTLQADKNGSGQTASSQSTRKYRCELKALGVKTNTWEAAAADRSTWKQEVKKGRRVSLSLSLCEENLTQQTEEKRSHRKRQLHADRPTTTFTYGKLTQRTNATPASVSSATPDDAEDRQFLTQRRRTPWSPETDGSLLHFT